MPYATTDDGVRLYYEEAGRGRSLILIHEFAGTFEVLNRGYVISGNDTV
jgi:hypothetical protein